MHRTPFILQMFGSIANYIDISPGDGSQSNFYRVIAFFNVMVSYILHVSVN